MPGKYRKPYRRKMKGRQDRTENHTGRRRNDSIRKDIKPHRLKMKGRQESTENHTDVRRQEGMQERTENLKRKRTKGKQ